MSSPLNKLADALPSFILQMQEIKTRQEYYEAITTYRQGMLAETINRNEMAGIVREEKQRLGVIDREREISEDMFKLEAQGEGWAAAKYGRDMVGRFFPEGIPAKRIAEEVAKPSQGLQSSYKKIGVQMVKKAEEIAEFRRISKPKGRKEIKNFQESIALLDRGLARLQGKYDKIKTFAVSKNVTLEDNEWDVFRAPTDSLGSLQGPTQAGPPLDTLNVEDPAGIFK